VIPLHAIGPGNGATRSRADRIRRIALLVVLALAAVALGAAVYTVARVPAGRAPAAGTGSGGGGAGRSPSVPSTAPVAPTTTPTTAPSLTGVPLGIYAGPGAAPGAEAVNQALGGRISYAMDFLPQTSWTALTDPTWLAAAWGGSPFDLVLGVPMLPNHGASLAQGAQGAYDAEFTLLAQRLVSDGLGGAVLLVGWQPADTGTPWYVGTDAAAVLYVQYWDRIAAAMKAVPGATFVFEWDPGDSGTSPVRPASMYPGNAAVDVVGTDAFDVVPHGVPQAKQWASVFGRSGGPTWAATFAAQHHRLLALAMWGVVPAAAGGGGDAPAFVSDVLAWAAEQGVAMCVLWDYGTWAISGGTFPASYAGLVAAVGPGANAGSGAAPT
jgi:hypothetical protein